MSAISTRPAPPDRKAPAPSDTARTARSARARPAVDAPLGGMPLARFMREYWQRKPLLVRAAFPGLVAPISRAELAALAARDDVESRMLTSDGGRWRLRHGPFDRLPSRRRRQWTVLVQGVDLHEQAAHDILRRFRFVSDARLDDLMISIAGDGGGVGPHYDSYDVFLLQAAGRRRWRIGPTGFPDDPPALVPGLPLKIIAEPRFTQTHDLDPGDMLYLPPGWAHDGVAIGECITYSIGYRSPSRSELIAAWLTDWADQPHPPDARYTDASVAPTDEPGLLPERLLSKMTRWLAALRPDRAQMHDFIGRYLTEPKASVWFDRPAPMQNPARWSRRAARDGIALDRRSRALYRGTIVYINGEKSELEGTGPMRALVNERSLSPVEVHDAFRDARFATEMHRWWQLGWLHCNTAAASGANIEG